MGFDIVTPGAAEPSDAGATASEGPAAPPAGFYDRFFRPRWASVGSAGYGDAPPPAFKLPLDVTKLPLVRIRVRWGDEDKQPPMPGLVKKEIHSRTEETSRLLDFVPSEYGPRTPEDWAAGLEATWKSWQEKGHDHQRWDHMWTKGPGKPGRVRTFQRIVDDTRWYVNIRLLGELLEIARAMGARGETLALQWSDRGSGDDPDDRGWLIKPVYDDD